MTQIRDPIHGSIAIDERERAVVDSPFFQRLRSVRQLGFADLAFPGASHTRYAHALGAAHLSGKIFDAICARLPALPEAERPRLRSALRVAVLLHDLGHAPFSHASESIMPQRARLALPLWATGGSSAGQANHEDFTLKLLLDSELTDLLRAAYRPLDLPPEAIGSLVAGVPGPGGPYFTVRGIDYGPLLRQVVSSELDADRMDYLLRDSFYTGVNYGNYDLDWLVGHLGAHVHDGVAELAVGNRAIFAFEDFLLSRYHMFLSVYYHRTPICFDRMLRLYYREAPGEFEIPSAPAAYLRCDDVQLLTVLRASKNRWAQRIANRHPFRLLIEANPYDTGYDLVEIVGRLERAGIEHFATESLGMVSKYFGESGATSTIWVHVPDQRRFVPLEEYTPLFRRYEREVRIARIYVDPALQREARELAGLPLEPV
ncbi:HD domain-containing protein [Vulgatibacter sp.]|uniref:HD domain-containing protein n=1 Tax=Vulgatibacter sp. TaxID=1971226 RepID=UPI003566EDEE